MLGLAGRLRRCLVILWVFSWGLRTQLHSNNREALPVYHAATRWDKQWISITLTCRTTPTLHLLIRSRWMSLNVGEAVRNLERIHRDRRVWLWYRVKTVLGDWSHRSYGLKSRRIQRNFRPDWCENNLLRSTHQEQWATQSPEAMGTIFKPPLGIQLTNYQYKGQHH